MDVAVPARTAPADTRVLFLCPPIQDYLADGVFHGLRLLLGASVVEVPRRDFMYASYPEDRRSALYGRGFSLYCMLEDVDAARDTAIADALDGRFQAVVFGDITRGWRTFNDLAPGLERAGVPDDRARRLSISRPCTRTARPFGAPGRPGSSRGPTCLPRTSSAR